MKYSSLNQNGGRTNRPPLELKRSHMKTESTRYKKALAFKPCKQMCIPCDYDAVSQKSLSWDVQHQNFPSCSGSVAGKRPVCLRVAWLTGDSLCVGFLITRPTHTPPLLIKKLAFWNFKQMPKMKQWQNDLMVTSQRWCPRSTFRWKIWIA